MFQHSFILSIWREGVWPGDGGMRSLDDTVTGEVVAVAMIVSFTGFGVLPSQESIFDVYLDIISAIDWLILQFNWQSFFFFGGLSTVGLVVVWTKLGHWRFGELRFGERFVDFRFPHYKTLCGIFFLSGNSLESQWYEWADVMNSKKALQMNLNKKVTVSISVNSSQWQFVHC